MRRPKASSVKPSWPLAYFLWPAMPLPGAGSGSSADRSAKPIGSTWPTPKYRGFAIIYSLRGEHLPRGIPLAARSRTLHARPVRRTGVQPVPDRRVLLAGVDDGPRDRRRMLSAIPDQVVHIEF